MSSKDFQSHFQTIGKPTPLITSKDRVTGRAQYADDIQLQNPLTVRILRSHHPFAKILKIRTAQAKELPGVRAVITGADFHRTFGVLPISKDEPAIAKDTVRFVGEPVAAVAAEDAWTAEHALRLIEVDYEVLEPCFDPEKGLQPTSQPIHPELKKGNNLHKAVDQNFGNLEEGFQQAKVITEGNFEFLPVTHAFTEPHATQVEIDSHQNLTVYSATQVPHYLHRAMSEVLEIPLHKIRVVKPHLGGGFGGKSDPFPHEMIAAKLSLLTGRNTRVLFSREEVFMSHHGRHPTKMKMKLGLDPQKGITALDANITIDGGSYASFGVVTTYYNGVLLQGPYPLENFGFKCNRVYTNKPMCGAMRGHGGVNPRFASEVLLDMACTEAKLDPCEQRLKMLHRENTLTKNGFRITSCNLPAGLSEAMKRSGWKEKYAKLPYGKGIGVACGFFISGSNLPIHWNEMPQSVVRMTIDFDGGVTVYSGASDIGQGSDTMLAQMASEVLGLPMDKIQVLAGDTRHTPIDLGSYSSRVTFMAGNAGRNAAIELRRQLVMAACELLEIPIPEDMRQEISAEKSLGKSASASAGAQPLGPESEDYFRQGEKAPNYASDFLGPNPNYLSDGFLFRNEKIIVTKGPKEGSQLDYAKVLEKALAGRGALQSRGVYISPKLGLNFKGSGAGLSPAYSFSAFITEVTVDPETGFVKVDKITCAHDCGFQLNPLAVQGQLEGSIHMGLGQALMEGMQYDGGAIQNASFLDYKMLSAFEQPEIDIVIPPSRENEGPFGAKEVGEGALAPVIPSLANAIYDAVGVRLMSVPITPEKVLAAIKAGTVEADRPTVAKGVVK